MYDASAAAARDVAVAPAGALQLGRKGSQRRASRTSPSRAVTTPARTVTKSLPGWRRPGRGCRCCRTQGLACSMALLTRSRDPTKRQQELKLVLLLSATAPPRALRRQERWLLALAPPQYYSVGGQEPDARPDRARLSSESRSSEVYCSGGPTRCSVA